jgi:acetylornithine deacetylase/succinyl-diaminopimelate desuccinylase-like protein
MDPLHRFKKWYAQNRDAVKDDYFRFLRFRSISTDPEYRSDVLACAEWLAAHLKNGGFHSEIIPTSGHPIVYAEDLSAGPDKPTLLIYGHYDVQPVDPVELWKSAPFEPTEQGGKVFARGAADNKGQIFYACTAALCWKKMGDPLPVNLKFCIEGEEEKGSEGLLEALPSLKRKMKADALAIVDFDCLLDGTPALTCGARGCISLEVTLTGSHGDLHSGGLGGIAYNPNRALAELLAQLWDEKGRVAVPGFYDGVLEYSKEELEQYAFSLDQDEVRKQFGIEALGGEKDRTMMEANCLRPTLEINGMFGGYTGPGVKTVIPAYATAKLTCRLVPNQDAEKTMRAVADFLKKRALRGMKVKVDLLGGIGAFRGDCGCEAAKAVARAASEATGKECARRLSGGSVPIASEMQRVFEVPTFGVGYELETDNIHAPNENFDMKRFEMGFLTMARAIELL